MNLGGKVVEPCCLLQIWEWQFGIQFGGEKEKRDTLSQLVFLEDMLSRFSRNPG